MSTKEATEIRVKGLMACEETDRKALLESWPKAEKVKAPKPGRTVTLTESTGEFPKEHKSFLREIGAKVTA